MPDVRLVAAGPAEDDLSEADYREIYDELRSRMTLRQFVGLVESKISPAWWCQYEAGKRRLGIARRNELRTAVGGLPEVRPSVGEALERVAKRALVWQVGTGVPDRVVLVGEAEHDPLTLRLNGDLQVVVDAPQTDDVTGVTRLRSDSPALSHMRYRRRYFRPCLPLEPAERIARLEELLDAARRLV